MDSQSILQQASQAAKAGNKPQAQVILANLLRREPHCIDAWLLLSELVDKKEQAIDCLNRVLKLAPNNEKAIKRLEELRQSQTPPVSPIVGTPAPVNPPPPVIPPLVTPPPVTPPLAPPKTSQLKKCPYCAEEIQEAAIVCQFCGKYLLAPTEKIIPSPKNPRPNIKSQSHEEEPKPPKSNPLVTCLGSIGILIVGCLVLSAIANIVSPSLSSSTYSSSSSNSSSSNSTSRPTAGLPKNISDFAYDVAFLDREYFDNVRLA